MSDLKTLCSGLCDTVNELRDENASLRTENARLSGELAQYRTLFNHAISQVDRVFQVESGKPAPLLPDFLTLGEAKFAGVVNLAKAYLSLRTLVGELSRTAERIKVKLEDALPYIGNPANPSHIPRAAINEAIDQLTAALAKADKIGGASDRGTGQAG